MPIDLGLATLYSLKGPDWAGNLYVEFDCSDATALGAVVANTTFTAYGSGSGSPTVYVSVVRPNLSVDLQSRISPAITWKSYRTLDSIAQGASFTAQKLADLNMGKGFCSAVIESGSLYASLGANQRAYSSMSDAIVSRAFVSIDGKPLVNPYDGLTQQEWDSFLGGNTVPTGYNVMNFIRESRNPDAAFPAQTLTSARRFEMDVDLAGAAGQGIVLFQEEYAGSPVIAPATGSS
jgi:hypothetical protein